MEESAAGEKKIRENAVLHTSDEFLTSSIKSGALPTGVTPLTAEIRTVEAHHCGLQQMYKWTLKFRCLDNIFMKCCPPLSSEQEAFWLYFVLEVWLADFDKCRVTKWEIHFDIMHPIVDATIRKRTDDLLLASQMPYLWATLGKAFRCTLCKFAVNHYSGSIPTRGVNVWMHSA